MRSEMQARARDIGAAVGAEVLLDERLGPYCSMRVGGEAAALLKPTSRDGLSTVVRELHAQGVPYRLLGGGSNLLAADEPLPFVVVQVRELSEAPVFEGASVHAPAGLRLAVLVRECMKRGLSGLEWAAGLPGSVGGAVVGNAGAFGGEMGPSVREVLLMSVDGTLRRHEVQDGDFSYRRSFVGADELVLEVLLELNPSDVESVRAEFARVNAKRAGSQPKGGHSSGCMFKNPPGDAAGRLIDECGLKGLKHGGASVSERHANFIVNDGQATAADILAVMNEVRDTVQRATGVELEPEVRIWLGEPEGGELMSRRPARRYYGTARNAPTRPVADRSARSRLPWRVALGLAALLGIGWAADRVWLQLTTAPAFEVRDVDLAGVANADPERLRASADLAGRNIFTLDLDLARAGLLTEAWVGDARLRRRLPDSVLVEITEKRPAALEQRPEGLALLDEAGGDLETSVASGRFELPMLEGAATQEARARAARVLTAVRERAPELWLSVESLDVGRSDRLVLRAEGHPPIWLAGPESVDELLRWVENAMSLQREFGAPAHVDARWRDRLYLGREHGNS